MRRWELDKEEAGGVPERERGPVGPGRARTVCAQRPGPLAPGHLASDPRRETAPVALCSGAGLGTRDSAVCPALRGTDAKGHPWDSSMGPPHRPLPQPNHTPPPAEDGPGLHASSFSPGQWFLEKLEVCTANRLSPPGPSIGLWAPSVQRSREPRSRPTPTCSADFDRRTNAFQGGDSHRRRRSHRTPTGEPGKASERAGD